MASPENSVFLPHKRAIARAIERKIVDPQKFYENTDQLRQAFWSASFTADVNVLAQLYESITGALEKGQSFKDWKKSLMKGNIIDPKAIEDALGRYGRGYFETVFRNALQGAYNAGRFQQQVELADIMPWLVYDAVNDNRTRPTHRALDNKKARIDDPIWDRIYPPNGHNCRCVVRQVTDEEARSYEYLPGDAAADDGWNAHGGKSATLKKSTKNAEKRAKTKIQKKLAIDKAGQKQKVAASLEKTLDISDILKEKISEEAIAGDLEKAEAYYNQYVVPLIDAIKKDSKEDFIESLEALRGKIHDDFLGVDKYINVPEIKNLMEEIGLPTKRPSRGVKRALFDAYKLLPAGAFIHALPFMRKIVQRKGEKIKIIKTSRGYFSEIPGKYEIGISIDETGNPSVTAAAHEYMHAIQNATDADKPIKDYHCKRVLEKKGGFYDTHRKNKFIQPKTEYALLHDAKNIPDTYESLYAYKYYGDKKTIEPYLFMEFWTMIHQGLISENSINVPQYRYLFEDKELIKRFFASLLWTDRMGRLLLNAWEERK